MLFYLEYIPLDPSRGIDPDNQDSYAVKLTIRGSMNLENSGELALAARTIYNGGVKRLILNLEHLSYIDSSGIGLMLKLRKQAKAVEGEFVLLNVPPRIKEAFDLVNLKEYVSSFFTEEKALEYFRLRRATQGQ